MSQACWIFQSFPFLGSAVFFQSALYRCVCRGVYVEVRVDVCVGLVLKQQGSLGFNKLNHR